MIAPRCTSCGRPVLELRGQFAFFDSFLISNGEPPEDTAGAYHLPCLAAAGIAARWHAAVIRSLVDVRRHTVLGRAVGWVAVRSPNGDPSAISPDGVVLPLRFRTRGKAVDGGTAFAVHEREYNLELEDTAAIGKLQAALRSDGRISLAATFEALGIADCLVRPDLQADSAFVLDDPDAAEDWSPRFVCAAVTYTVWLPDAVAAFARVGG